MNIERVPFHGDTIQAVRDERGVWVPLRPVCDNVTIDGRAQQQRLQRQPWATACMIHAVGDDGRKREMFCVHLESLPMWLATIEPSRVKAAVRPKLVRYQCEARDVLARHFLTAQPKAEPSPAPQVSAPQGARIGDTPEGRDEVKRRWRMTAHFSRQSMQRIGGFIRRKGQVLSPYRVFLCDWPRIEVELDDLAMGKILLPALPPKKQKPEDPRQLRLVQ